MPVTCEGRQVVAVIDQIRAVAKERLQRPIGMLPEEQMAAVEQALLRDSGTGMISHQPRDAAGSSTCADSVMFQERFCGLPVLAGRRCIKATSTGTFNGSQ